MMTVNAKANITMFFTEFLSVPKIMGIGPIIITPAPFTFPFVELPEDAIIMAVIMTKIPATKSAMPSA